MISMIEGWKPTSMSFEDQMKSKDERRKKVLEISDKISQILEVRPTEVEHGMRMDLDKYAIVQESRLFGNAYGWVTIFEIYPRQYHSIGYSNYSNPEYIVIDGTTTINLPPERMVNAFFKELEAYKKPPDNF